MVLVRFGYGREGRRGGVDGRGRNRFGVTVIVGNGFVAALDLVRQFLHNRVVRVL